MFSVSENQLKINAALLSQLKKPFITEKILKQVEDESARRMEHFLSGSELINIIVFFTRIKNEMDLN